MSDTESDNRAKVRVRMRGGREGGFAVEGLTEGEIEMMEAAMHGHNWVRSVDGRLESVPSYKPLPSPSEDPEMALYWQLPTSDKTATYKTIDFGSKSLYSPSIIIQHLCGYSFSPENYQFQARQLEGWGFVCMRSQRGKSGEFWEQWYLPGLFAAKGGLKEAINALDPLVSSRHSEPSRKKKKEESTLPRDSDKQATLALNVAISFLCHHASFGTLDVVVQRAAACID